jgi:hypothetical protein
MISCPDDEDRNLVQLVTDGMSNSVRRKIAAAPPETLLTKVALPLKPRA